MSGKTFASLSQQNSSAANLEENGYSNNKCSVNVDKTTSFLERLSLARSKSKREENNLPPTTSQWFDVEDAPLAVIHNDNDMVVGGSHSNSHSRPLSRPQSRSKKDNNNNQRYLSPVTPPKIGARSRVLSRKKERRWANALHAGVDSYVAAENWEALNEEFDVGAASRMIFEQEHRNVFDDLSPEMKSDFIESDGSFAVDKLDFKRSPQHVLKPTALMRFSKVDKKLRTHLLETGTREPFSRFISKLEMLLFQIFDAHVDNVNLISSSAQACLGKVLLEPIVVKVRKDDSREIDFYFSSPLWRLLAHGLCQFHGFCSKSVTRKTNSGVENRVLRIHGPKIDSILAGWTVHDNDEDFINGEGNILVQEPTKGPLILGGEQFKPLLSFLSDL